MSGKQSFTLSATVTGGKLSLDNERRYRELAKGLPDGRYDVTIEKHSKLGVQQRKYYFAVIVPAFADHWGVDEDDAHELIKQNCNKKTIEIVNKQTGEVEEKVIAGSTAGFTTDQWALLIERCHRWGATDFGFVIPDPDKEWMFNRKDAA